MDKKLFLTSAGLVKETRDAFLKLLATNPSEITVAFIPTAADPEEDKRFVEKDKQLIYEIGMKIQEIDLKNENEHSLLQKVLPLQVIYIEGGNTFYLLDWIRKSGFDKVLRKFIDEGKIYVGVSAGSILVGPNIELSNWKHDWDKNIVNLQDLTGLNLVPFAISPHFAEEDRALLEQKSKTVNYPLVALNDTQAILVNGAHVKIEGVGEKVSFNSFSEEE